LADFRADQQAVTAHAGDRIRVGQQSVPPEDVIDVLGQHLGSLRLLVRQPQRVPLGTYRGLHFGLVVQTQAPPDAYLQGAATRHAMLSRDHHGPRAVLNAIERLAGEYTFECERLAQDLAIAEAQLRDYQARLDMPFAYEGYLSALTDLRDQLRLGLASVQSP